MKTEETRSFNDKSIFWSRMVGVCGWNIGMQHVLEDMHGGRQRAINNTILCFLFKSHIINPYKHT
jgi:hypothetical protein